MKSSLQDRRVWQLGAVVVALLVVAASWFLFISPELSAADSSRADAAATRQSNDQLVANLTELKKQAGQVPLYRAQLIEALAALPPDSGLPSFTRQLTAQTAAAHVVIDGITVGGIAPVTTTAGSAATTQSAVPTAGSVYALQISLTTHGSLEQQLVFLDNLQYHGARRTLVTGTTFAPYSGSVGTSSGAATNSIDGSSTLTAQLTIFSAPQTPAQLAVLKKLLAGTTGN